jgi:pimeloyl-ACP methyl ester carboxylesterase
MISKTLVSGLCAALLACVTFGSIADDSTPATADSNVTKACVILLHGLARTSASMNEMQSALIESGYLVAKIDYPSREKTVQELATPAIKKGLASCALQAASPVHVVTHSMGGILFRQYVHEHGADEFARTVMLAPPNHGSEAVDSLKEIPGFRWLNGPAGLQLGTDENSLPLALGPATSDVAVIAGTFSINIVLSTYLPDPDDGKVSVASTRLEGMCAHLQQDVSHPYIMQDEQVIKEVISYLNTGEFIDSKAEYPECSNKYSSN